MSMLCILAAFPYCMSLLNVHAACLSSRDFSGMLAKVSERACKGLHRCLQKVAVASGLAVGGLAKVKN
jgi:hypothetical protein